MKYVYSLVSIFGEFNSPVKKVKTGILKGVFLNKKNAIKYLQEILPKESYYDKKRGVYLYHAKDLKNGEFFMGIK